MSRAQAAAERDARAADWVARLDRGELSELEQAALDAWLAADIRNHGAYVRATSAWESLAGAPVRMQARPSRRMLFGAGLAAAVPLAAGAWLAEEHLRWRTYEAGAGELRKITLAEGVLATLDARSRLRVDATFLRRIEVDFGHVGFEIVRRLERPLQVVAASLNISVSQGSFSARRDAGAVVLTVVQGDVRTRDRFGDKQVRAGQQVRFDRGAVLDVTRLSPESAARAEAWRSGHLAVNGETVGEAVEAFNRYNRGQITIESPTLMQEKLVGLFRIDDPRAFAEAVVSAFGGAITTTADGIVIHAPANSSS
jgi:transmembrane sensor